MTVMSYFVWSSAASICAALWSAIPPFGRIAARHEGNLQACHCQGLYMSLYLNSSISCTICAYCRASAWLSSACSTRLKSLRAAPHSLRR